MSSWPWRTRFVCRSALNRLSVRKNAHTRLAELRGVFINTSYRQDRRVQVESELAKMGLTSIERLTAVERANGALGCALSHISAVKNSLPSGLPVMVCEDDLEFLVSPERLAQIVNEFLRNSALDVLCLAYNARDVPVPIGSGLLCTTQKTQTTACYIVKPKAQQQLIAAWTSGVRDLEEGNMSGAVDISWKKLQSSKLVFVVPAERAARQRPGFSDILEEHVDYGL